MANPVSSYIRRHVLAPERRSTLANPDNELLDALGAVTSPSGQRVSVDKALSLSPVWSAVQIISEAIAQCPLKVYRDVDGQPMPATNHWSWRVLHDKPNSFVAAGRFWASVSVHLMLWGNAFIWKRRDDAGLVDELYLLDPGQMTVKFDLDAREKSYVYGASDFERRPKRRFSDDEITHIMGMSVNGGITGESVIRCKAALGAALARDEFEGGFYARGATLSGVLEHPGNPSDRAVQHLRDSFKTLYAGSKKAHGTPVLEEGVTFKQVGSPLRDLMFVEAQQLSRTDIAIMFGLPPSYLGGSTGDSLTYATVEGNQIQFATQAVAPRTTAIQQAVSWDPSLLPQNIFSAKFDLGGLMRGDANARANFYKTLSDVKAIKVNEIRALEDMPGIEGGDKSPAKAEPVPAQLQLTDMPDVNGNGNGNEPREPVNAG